MKIFTSKIRKAVISKVAIYKIVNDEYAAVHYAFSRKEALSWAKCYSKSLVYKFGTFDSQTVVL
jgi:hypothetical protein